MRWAANLVALLMVASHLMGATYVVDVNSPKASDENPGTADLPLKSINRAAQLVQPGDTVIVKAGIYREHVRLTRSGKPGAPITFVAYPPGSVIITGADIVKGWKRLDKDAPIYFVPWKHRFVINVRPDGSLVEHHPDDERHKLWGRAELVLVDGRFCAPTSTLHDLREAWKRHSESLKSGKPSPVLQPPLPNLTETFAGMFCVDTQKQLLYLWLADGSDPNTRQGEAATRGALFGLSPWENRDGVQFVYVRGFVFRHAATFPQRAAVWLHGGNNLLEDCIVEEMAGSGVLVHGTMRRCIIRRCGHTGGGASGENFVNEDCVWEGNSWKPIDRGWDAGGFKVALAKGGVFRRCVFRRNGGPGLWLDIHVRHVVVTECVFWENEHHGLFVEISRDITIVRNLFVRNGVGIVGKVEWPDWGIAGLTIAESQNCIVAFNTFVGNKDGIALREQGPRPLETDDYGVLPYHNRGHIIVGNVSAFNRGYQLALWYDNGFFGWHPAEREKFKTEAAYESWLKANPDKVFDPTKVGMVVDRNLYFATNGQKLILYGVPWRPKHREFSSIAEWAKFTGFDQHSIATDPLFVDLTDNFRFRSQSPAWSMQIGWLDVPVKP
ncbi:MAG: right-handed parallel beta-helix repeat-containing protein [Armatimonadetes bacterium]|nr:right-handed parallel beta-helix repeat-containing protein [Armatimonadota bacterium]